MSNKVSYVYAARDEKSFGFLAVDAAKCGATVTINPENLTIVLTVTEEKINGTGDNPVNSLHETIHANELDVAVELMDDEPDLVKEVADLTKKNAVLKSERDRFSRWWEESDSKLNRVKDQVNAISVLMNEIFPDK